MEGSGARREGGADRPRLGRPLPLALVVVLVLSGAAAARDRVVNRQTLADGTKVRQTIERAHGRASYAVHVGRSATRSGATA
jgi:hypothetical protein